MTAGLYLAMALGVALTVPDPAAMYVLRVGIVLGELLLLYVALRTGARTHGRARWWRWLLAAAIVVTIMVGIAVASTGPVGGPQPDQLWMTYGQLGYLAPVGILVACLLIYPIRAAAGRDRAGDPLGRRWWITTLLDSVIAVGSVGILSWVLFLRRVVAATTAGGGENLVVTFSLCAASLLLVSVALVLWVFRRPSPAAGFALLSGALIAISASLLSFTTKVVFGDSLVKDGAELCWIVAGWCFLLACLHPGNTAATDPSEDRDTVDVPLPARGLIRGRERAGPQRWAHTTLPLLPLAIAVLVIVIDVLGGHDLEIVDVVALLALPLLVLARQTIMLGDNVQLLQRLERSERRLHWQAFHDPLTGLANRALFGQRIAHALSDQARNGLSLAVLYVDLDDFKQVNDTLGHGAGDRLLQLTAARLTRAVRAGDTVSRLGGDEFAILLVPGSEAPATVGSRVLTAVRAPALLAGTRHSVRASLGLVVAEAAEELSAELLLHRADAAMYAAKRTGKGSLTIYQPGLEEGRDGGEDSAHALRTALIRALRVGPGDDELRMSYQPIVTLPGGEPAGVQAELRWRHPDYGEVPATALVPTSERAWLFPVITLVALARICADLPRLRAGSTPPPVHLPLATTVPPTSAVLDAICAARADGRLRAGELVVDLLDAERGLDWHAWQEWTAPLSARDIQLCLADFGAADSNIVLLSLLPIDMVVLTPLITRIWTSPYEDPALQPRVDTLNNSIRRMLQQLGDRIIASDLASDSVPTALALGICLATGQLPNLPPSRSLSPSTHDAHPPAAPAPTIRAGPPR
ncbi:diguanylate cyclase domain-containing protein [Candidatus Frankia nodulisporulans]|uniref:diguanylate cyclase domain-containing protein n=1 Tax=Candidatus Frankia nodulisporulans TaxID=2060052 RepID=UPI0013D33C78|nr:diguanylate cyclase [Candidatus Frankia nodulisporulans]